MKRLIWIIALAGLAGCGETTPDGTCLTDFQCESDQICGLGGLCLFCENCDLGRVGTCTAPAYPGGQQPSVIVLKSTMAGDVLIYSYKCSDGTSEFKYAREDGQRCFAVSPDVQDPCSILP